MINDGVPCKYIFDDDEDYYLPCELVDNAEQYEKIQIDKSLLKRQNAMRGDEAFMSNN